MKKFLAFAVFMLTSAVCHAQTLQPIPSYDPQSWFLQSCPSCRVAGWVDAPANNSTVTRGAILFMGWGFQPASGLAIDRVEFAYESSDGLWVPLKQDSNALQAGSFARPDVQAAYPSAPINSGWYIFLTNDPPVGARRIMVQMWHGIFHSDLVLTINVQ